MKTSLFIGKLNPFHDGHKFIVDKLLKEGRQIIIFRKNKKWEPQEKRQILLRFDLDENIFFADMPHVDFDEVVYGRKVGYKFREIVAPKGIQKISSTKIRERLSK